MTALPPIDADTPILIAGPTASGKSALALEIAERFGGIVINADAIQVFGNWRILTARPPDEDLARAPHALYGHVSHDADWSVGHWLRALEPFLAGGPRPIITGGTGLYFTALTQGLADIPETPAALRQEANAIVASAGFDVLLGQLDAPTRARIDTRNPMRVQRAWEVLQATGRGLADWQDNTPPPRLPLDSTIPILFDVDKDWLNRRIACRFEAMVRLGALKEAEANLPTWDPALLSSKAIGAPELIAHLRGEIPLDEACRLATIATRQFAKRQRTWFRSKMRLWHRFQPSSAC